VGEPAAHGHLKGGKGGTRNIRACHGATCVSNDPWGTGHQTGCLDFPVMAVTGIPGRRMLHRTHAHCAHEHAPEPWASRFILTGTKVPYRPTQVFVMEC
jgi:hypothetical protein